MRYPLKPIWDVALSHWDEVIPTPADYAACISEVNTRFEVWLGLCQFGDEWTDADVLLAAFWHMGYNNEIMPHLGMEPKHAEINRVLHDRAQKKWGRDA